jgi:hypothetical protein
METRSCIYCGRTLNVNELVEKAGKYRCKDEMSCLEYQDREDPANSVENPDYISDVVKSSLGEAAQRIAAYKKTANDRTKGGIGENGRISHEFRWMISVLDVLALQYKENHKFLFQYDETNSNEYKISFNDTDRNLVFTVKIDNTTGSRYSLSVAKEEPVAGTDPLYKEFIYKLYPDSEKEDVVKDLSVILIALEEEKELISVLLSEFRMEIESRYYHHDAGAD